MLNSGVHSCLYSFIYSAHMNGKVQLAGVPNRLNHRGLLKCDGAANLKSVCVCVCVCLVTWCFCDVCYLDVFLRYVGEESRKKYFEKLIKRQLSRKIK